MATSQDFVNWVCGPKLNPRFLMYIFLASRDYFRSLASGAVHKTVYMPTAQALRICIPDRPIQDGITSDLDAALEKAEILTQQIDAERAAIEALPAAILRHAFAGAL
jgi:type I restriction enzyme S subunit